MSSLTFSPANWAACETVEVTWSTIEVLVVADLSECKGGGDQPGRGWGRVEPCGGGVGRRSSEWRSAWVRRRWLTCSR